MRMVRHVQDRKDTRRPAPTMDPVQLKWLIGLLLLTQEGSMAGLRSHARRGVRPPDSFETAGSADAPRSEPR